MLSRAAGRPKLAFSLFHRLALLLFSLWQSKCCRCLQSGRKSQTAPKAATSIGLRSGTKSASDESFCNATGLEPRQFIYVYDLGPEYTDRVLELEPAWYSHQYDVEKFLTELLVASNAVRTVHPHLASLFFVPFYSSRLTLFHLRDWENNMREAVEKSSKVWEEILVRVRRDFPFFNRTNGRDHFSILTLDHGRCHSLTFVHPNLVGEMFFVTYNGDKFVRSVHANKERNMQAITYNYAWHIDPSMPDIPCYMPDRDMVVPVLVSPHLPTVPPSASHRDIVALFRFGASQHHGVPIPHHNHEIRRELLAMLKDSHIEGWDFAVKSEADTDFDWRRAIFCICPPGHSQWTSRLFKSLISGCIPVTFFREHDSPWADELDYSLFSLNVDPDLLSSLPARLAALQHDPALLQDMQRNVAAVQDMFRWSGRLDAGAEAMLLKRLCRRAEGLRSFQHQMSRLQGLDETNMWL